MDADDRPRPHPPAPLPTRVVVFLDYQNAHGWARQLYCPYGTPLHRCLINPIRLAELIVERRANPGVLTGIRVYRGRTDPERAPEATAASDAQTSAWLQDRRLVAIRRQLNYRRWPDERPREKGIDVRLAVDFVRLAMEKRYDVGVLMSSDSDLAPAIETVYELRAAHVEVAAWTGAPRLRFPGEPQRPWCHYLSENDFELVRDWTDYVNRGGESTDVEE